MVYAALPSGDVSIKVTGCEVDDSRMTTQPTLSRAALVAGSIVTRLTHAAAWLLSFRRELQRHELKWWESEAMGLPEGSTIPAVHCFPVTGSPWWRVDVWSDGDCLHIDALGWTGEVHYIPKGRQQEATASPL